MQQLAKLPTETATENQNTGFLNTIARSKNPKALELASWMKFRQTKERQAPPLGPPGKCGRGDNECLGFGLTRRLRTRRRPRPRPAAGPSPSDLGTQRCARPPLTSGSGRSEAITQPSRAGPGQRRCSARDP